jgi:hypothetical protein
MVPKTMSIYPEGVGARSVGLGGKLFVQLPQRPFLVEVKGGDGGAEAFSPPLRRGGSERFGNNPPFVPLHASQCQGEGTPCKQNRARACMLEAPFFLKFIVLYLLWNCAFPQRASREG